MASLCEGSGREAQASLLYGGGGQGGHRPLAPLPAQETAGTVGCCLGSPTQGSWGLSKPCLPLPLNGPVNRASRGPAQPQGRTDAASQGPEFPLAGLPRASSLQRVSVLQAAHVLHDTDLSSSCASLYSAGQRAPPSCSPKQPDPPVPTLERLDRVALGHGVWVGVLALQIHAVGLGKSRHLS